MDMDVDKPPFPNDEDYSESESEESYSGNDEDYSETAQSYIGRSRNYSWITKDDRSRRAQDFVDVYAKSLINYPVVTACTWLGAERLWNDKWLGMNWVALQGIDSLCVVALTKDVIQLELKASPSCTEYFLCLYWNAIVNRVEDIQDRMLGGSCNFKRPFSVVSVISGTRKVRKRSGHEASRAEYCAKKTSKFLQEEMKSGATFTFDKTMQTAVSAFQHLFSREFNAYEIRVFTWKDGDFIGKELQQRCQDTDLEELLVSINEPDNGPDKPEETEGLVEQEIKKHEEKLRQKFTPKKDGTLLRDGSKHPSREGQGDGSSWLSGKSKALEKVTLPKEVRESRVQRRQLRTKVRKSPSKKATEEKGDAHDLETWWEI